MRRKRQIVQPIPAWRFYYWGTAAAVVAWAAWQRFALPLDPIADPDTWGYLAPALRKLVGRRVGHTDGRNFVYPAFIFSILRLFGDFRAIVIVQHLLGLVAGVLFLITWRRAWIFVGFAAQPGGPRWIGTGGGNNVPSRWRIHSIRNAASPEGETPFWPASISILPFNSRPALLWRNGLTAVGADWDRVQLHSAGVGQTQFRNGWGSLWYRWDFFLARLVPAEMRSRAA
jgi:hypothetical protein